MLRALLTAFCAAAALSAPAAARAQLVGYECVDRGPFGPGFLLAYRYHPLAAERPGDEIAWDVRKPFPERWGLNEIKVTFATPRPGEAIRRPLRLSVAYSVQGTPKTPLWLLARMGDSWAREALFLPPPHAFQRFRPGQAGGYGSAVALSGAAFEQAYAAGLPLEVFLLRADGSPATQRLEPLADRDHAREALDGRWREVLRKSAAPRDLCVPVEIAE